MTVTSDTRGTLLHQVMDSSWYVRCRYRGRRRRRRRIQRETITAVQRCVKFRWCACVILGAWGIATLLLGYDAPRPARRPPPPPWGCWWGCSRSSISRSIGDKEGGAEVFVEGGAASGEPTKLQSLRSLDRHRRLSGSTSCDQHHFAQGGIVQALLLIVGILFTFNGLAIVCDEFFQASLEKISDVLELTPDVAGATFLAAGSSAPELFTSFADVFGPSNSIGVGTIVGSAMFNMLVIVAISAAVATRGGNSLKIDHRVVARDVSFYVASITILAIAFIDGEIHWWEGLIMVLGYGAYVLFMKFNSRLLAMCTPPRVQPFAVEETKSGRDSKREGAAETRELGLDAAAPTPAVVAAGEATSSNSIRRLDNSGGRGGELSVGEINGDGRTHRTGLHDSHRRASRALRVSFRQTRGGSMKVDGLGGEEDHVSVAATVEPTASVAMANETSSRRRSSTAGKTPASRGDAFTACEKAGATAGWGDLERGDLSVAGVRATGAREIDLEEDQLQWPVGWGERFLFMFGLPFMVGLSLTVPDCSRPEYEKYYVTTFVMSIMWISFITSYMVELATGAACILGVSPVVMGTLVLAVGTSVPDMIGSIIAAKNGEASMAIANAVGSNVFDILLGLGLPWFLRPFFVGGPTQVATDDVLSALLILFCTVSVFVGSLMWTRWYMNQKLGYCLLFAYAVYVFYTIAAEAFA